MATRSAKGMRKRPIPGRVYYSEVEYELQARRAVERPNNSAQEVFVEKCFPPGSLKELERLREKQRAMGKPDSDFWPPDKRRHFGLQNRPGRRKAPSQDFTLYLSK